MLKPPNMTSFDVVAYLKRLLKTGKIGHTGTLDPDAVGVLPICVGNATKTIEFLMEKNKKYRAELVLGVATDTQDASGNITDVRDINVSRQEIIDVIHSFKGSYQQVPPMYSAVKIDGKRLYELAREGVTVERKPRKVDILSLEIIDIYENNRIIFDVECSKGTYIRTLCADIGEKLGCGGHMSFLIRTRSGAFDISTAYTLEKIEKYSIEGLLDNILVNSDKAFEGLPEVILDSANEKKLLNGIPVGLGSYTYGVGQLMTVYNSAGSFIALGEIILRNGELRLKSRKVFRNI